ncbi:MAG: hypothetical protein ACYC56_11605, partial [Candidatus Aquicultor sp.]
ALIAAASLVGVLLSLGAITTGQVESIIPFSSLASFFRANLVAASLVSMLLLAVVMALSVLWLRAQFAEAVRAVSGGMYEVPEEGPGVTEVNYNAVEHAIDNVIKRIPGVMDSQTHIYAEQDGRLFAHSSLMVKRSADLHTIDSTIRESINRSWLNKFGSNLSEHDITVRIEPVESRVA